MTFGPTAIREGIGQLQASVGGKPGLKPKHEMFAQAIAKGLSQRQAAIAAGFPPKGADKTGYRLAKSEVVRARVAELQSATLIVMPTREEDVSRLYSLGKKAEDAGQYAAAIRAQELIGRIAGHYIERVERRDLTTEALALSAQEQWELLQRAIQRLSRETGLVIEHQPDGT